MTADAITQSLTCANSPGSADADDREPERAGGRVRYDGRPGRDRPDPHVLLAERRAIQRRRRVPIGYLRSILAAP